MTPTFIRSVSSIAEFPTEETRPQIALVGRANAGKSSLINSLANQKDLSHASATPGRTRLINLFDFGQFVLVDLPGYGFSRASKMERKGFEKLIYDYLSESAKLMGVIVILDSGVGATDLDMEMFAFLRDMQMPHLAVANKVDKLSRSAAMAALERIEGQVQPSEVVAHSNVTKVGRGDVILWIKKTVSGK
jgi:GTP-binding protein